MGILFEFLMAMTVIDIFVFNFKEVNKLKTFLQKKIY